MIYFTLIVYLIVFAWYRSSSNAYTNVQIASEERMIATTDANNNWNGFLASWRDIGAGLDPFVGV